MLLLVTGAPGASKTSHIIDKFMDEKKRPIFYHNISINDEGKRSLGWIEFTREQVLEWKQELPPNAVLIVDEAQEIWPIRPPSKPVPPSCSHMERHRQGGVDLVLITQHPGLVDPHIRKLVNEHIHFSRPFSMPFAVQYHSGSGPISPDNRADLQRCTESKKPLPKRVWPLYKSAEVHTHKAKVPKVVYAVVLFALLAAYLIWKFLSGFGPAAPTDYEQVKQANGGYAAIAPAQSGAPQKSLTWAELLEPEIPGIPYTAPLYREQAEKPLDVPRIAGCMGLATDCKCYTQQGTRIHGITNQTCMRHLKAPSFDHLKPPPQPNQQYGRQLAQTAGEARAAAVLIPASTRY